MTREENSVQKDQSILETMILKIDRYFSNNLHVSSLISSLENLLNQLSTVDEVWKRNFRALWLDIEIAYSVALDLDLEKLTEEGIIITSNSLYELKKIIEEKIDFLKGS